MKKIVIVSSSPFVSGAEISLKQFLEKVDDKYQFFIITGNKKFFEPINTVSTISISPIINRTSWFQFLIKSAIMNYQCFARLLKFKPDIIYFNTTNSFLNLFWIGLFFLRTKKVWHVRDVLKNKWVTKYLSFFTDVIVCNSEFISNMFKSTSKKKVVHGGIDISKYKLQNRIHEGDIKSQIKFKTVACIAQLTPWKNQIDFIKAAQIIHKKNLKIKFLLIGGTLNQKDNVYKNALIEEVQNHNLEGVVELVGFQKNIVNVLSEIDVLIHPAIEEPFGRVLIEAMSMEIPVVAYQSGGPCEIIMNNKTGYLVTPYSYQQLAANAIRLLDNDDLRYSLGQAARKRVFTYFSIEKYVNTMRKLFEIT